MRNQSSVKQEFLRKWITGLRRYSCEKKNMSFFERKKAIKLSADLAMASTRDKTTRWSQALIANNTDNVFIASSSSSSPKKSSSSRSRNMTTLMRRSRPTRVKSAKKEMSSARCIAKRLMEKRTRKLKNLLPGGESMDEGCLVAETLDYIQSLRDQIEVMRCLVTASQLIINPS
ncbi:hypothetical protein PIB30_021764 [Stylosanthes scabra]|uniref:IBH1-like N-terminal domain-containing protein n=1 Tax=Stylosanthes scabra TaxID=79078 RepID=A0ABU6U7Y9_9FABA|nr:hypothetical protein [Stylosanthes scabra]